jgi:hypothetical protein
MLFLESDLLIQVKNHHNLISLKYPDLIRSSVFKTYVQTVHPLQKNSIGIDNKNDKQQQQQQQQKFVDKWWWMKR